MDILYKNYKFRCATVADTGSIIDLLKVCLGEKSVKKTNEYWKWKHINNPFGESFVLLAFDQNTLISVRTFMRWEWIKDGEVFKAVRAVDTVTHPDYRRKGLFKNLTTSLLEEMLSHDIDFVYNTPNDNSRPGNLKMGWKEFVKLKIKINVNLLSLIKNRVRKRIFDVEEILLEHKISSLDKIDLNEFLAVYHDQDINKFKTNVSRDYLKWRYQEVPICNYGLVLAKDNSFLFFFRLKTRGAIRELRITDIFLSPRGYSNNKIKSTIKNILNRYKADLATLSGESGEIFLNRSTKWGFVDVGRRGLMVTIRPLNKSEEIFLDPNKWAWGSADMELF